MTRLLMIDADPTRAQRLAERLRPHRFEIAVEGSFLFALTNLEWQRHDLILVRAGTIDGMTPSEFCATVKHDPALRGVPLILAGPIERNGTSALWQFDIVVDGDDLDRLAAEVVQAAARQTSAAPGQCESEVSADLPGVSFDSEVRKGDLRGLLELLEVFGLALQSGRIIIGSERHREPIYLVLDHGQLVHAVFGAHEGGEAFRRLIGDLGGPDPISYRFEPAARWRVSTYPRSIRRAERMQLLEEAAASDLSSAPLPTKHRRGA